MAVEIQLIAEDDWISPLGGFRRHAQMLLAEIGLNALLKRVENITTQKILVRTVVGVSCQWVPNLIVGPASKLLLSYAIIDHEWPLFRLGLTVKTRGVGLPILKIVSLVEIQQNEVFSIRRTFSRLVSTEDLDISGLNNSKFNNLLVHVPIVVKHTNDVSLAWTFLGFNE